MCYVQIADAARQPSPGAENAVHGYLDCLDSGQGPIRHPLLRPSGEG